nr:MAG TPA: hypothetical protein [Caudoviricetes sp.]
MTVRELVIANERWYCDTPLLVIDSSDKRAMTVEEIFNGDDIADRIVVSFNRSTIYILKG